MRYHDYDTPQAAWDAWGYAIMAGRAYLEAMDDQRSKVCSVVSSPSGYLEYQTDIINHPRAAIMAYAPEGFLEF